MISIVSVCYSRALDKSMPGWLCQEGIDFEVVVVVGPGIERTPHPKVRYIDWPSKEFTGCCEAWNTGYKAASGDIIYSAYSDMVLQDKRYIARLATHYKPNRIVNRQAIRPDGSLDIGVWGYGVLFDKALLAKSGGWDTRYDGGYAWEDAHFMHALVKAGGELVILPPAKDGKGLKHIDHPSARDKADWQTGYLRNKNLYNDSFPERTIMDMYADGAFKVVRDEEPGND